MSSTAVPAAADYQACLAEPSRVVQTSRGPIEYAERGTGPPLLSLHGSPAAFEQGLLIAEFARAAGFRVIAASRPGYSRTPLSAGRTPLEQADTLAALLDTLDLDTVAVLAMSGGGPAGYALAGTHPDRVCCLVQVESIALPATAPRLGRLGLRLTAVAGLAAWMIDRFPARMLTSLGAPPTTDPDLRAAQVALARGIITTATGSAPATTTTPPSSPTCPRYRWARSPAPPRSCTPPPTPASPSPTPNTPRRPSPAPSYAGSTAAGTPPSSSTPTSST